MRRILRSLEKIVVIDIVRDKETKIVFDINRKEFIRKNVFELKGKSMLKVKQLKKILSKE